MKLSPFVGNFMSYALSSMSYVVAVVYPEPKGLAKWAEANGKPEVVVFDAVNQARKRRVSHEEPLGAEAPGRRLRSGRLCAA